ncbi:MAG: TolC family protein [Cyclobacteriaceae bacterium]
MLKELIMNKKLRIVSMCLGLCLGLILQAKSQTVLTLEEALRIAQEKSPDIATSQLNLERSRKNLEAQNAALKSNFSLRLNPLDFSRQRQFNETFATWNTFEDTRTFGSFNVSQPIRMTDATVTLINQLAWQNSSNSFQESNLRSYSNNLRVEINQPLFTYNRTKLELKELELDLENTQISYNIQSLELERSVTQSFYQVYQQQVGLQIAQEELANQELGFEITKNKVEADLLPREELYQAELNLATSRSSLNNRSVALENAKDAFKQTIGISLYEDIEVRYDDSFTPVLVNMEFAINHGLDKRREIRQRRIDIEQSQFNLIRTNSLNEFRGDLSLSMGIFGDDPAFNNIYQSPTQSPRVSLSLVIPLWDWGEKKARLDADRATVQTRQIALDQERNNITRTIRETFRSVQNLETQVKIAERNVENAKLTYEINLERYRNGDLTSLDLNQYQQQLSTKKSDLSNARTDYKLELLNLKIQTLWDFEKNESLVP